MKDCCSILENLSEPETPNPGTPELTVRTCKCGAKHYLLDADALDLNIFGTDTEGSSQG
jgi:hypothetical protein